MKLSLNDCIDVIESGKREKGGALKNGIPSIGAEHLQKDGKINWNTNSMKYISKEFFDNLNSGKLQENDILIVKDGATTGKVAYVNIIPELQAAINEHIYLLRPNKNILPRYLYFYLKSDIGKAKILKFFHGAAIGGINKDFLSIILDIPLIEQQQKIVDVLDKVENLIDKRQQQLDLLDELIKSRFIEMFGDPVINPMGWELKKLKDLTIKISDGVHAKPNYTTEGMPFISVLNINKGILDFSNCKYVSKIDYDKMIQSTNPEKYDILYTKVGATYGIPAYVDTDRNFCLYVSVCLIKPNHDIVNSKFLTESMRLPYIKHQADKRIKGIGVPDLHLNQIREFNILFPPIELQNKFATFVEQVEKSKESIKKSLEELNLLKDSLMQKYFG